MNELYKTITADAWSIIIFYLLFLVISFSISVFVASTIKTVIDYHYMVQLRYITALAGLSTPAIKSDTNETKD